MYVWVCLSHTCSLLIILMSHLVFYSYYDWLKVYGYFSYSSVPLPKELFKILNIIRTRITTFSMSFQLHSKLLIYNFLVCLWFFCWFLGFFFCFFLKQGVLPYATVILLLMHWALPCFRRMYCKTLSKFMLKSEKVRLQFSIYAICFSVLEAN